jgi:regulator of protease activity HflC (stomatin/prohibitin superfamily)
MKLETKSGIKYTAIAGAVFVGLVSLSAALGSFYTIQDGRVGVLNHLGKYDDDEKMPGWHWKLPFIQDVIEMDAKLQTVNYKYNNGGYGKISEGLYVMPRISILDNKNLPIGIDITIQYIPVKEDMSDILRTYGPNYLEKKINAVVRDVVRDVASGYNAENIAKDRGVIGEQMKVKLDEEFANLPFILNAVALRAIDLPEIVDKKIKEVQEAKQEEQRLEMKEKQATVNKRIAIIKAEQVEQQKIIEARGQAQALLEVATAEAEAIRMKGESLKQNPEVIQLNAVQQWDGILPKFTGGNVIPFINVDNIAKGE